MFSQNIYDLCRLAACEYNQRFEQLYVPASERPSLIKHLVAILRNSLAHSQDIVACDWETIVVLCRDLEGVIQGTAEAQQVLEGKAGEGVEVSAGPGLVLRQSPIDGSLNQNSSRRREKEKEQEKDWEEE